jgi:hypothetical protein
MENQLLRHPSTTSCSHGCINPLKQRKSVDTSKVLFAPQGTTVSILHCDIINETLDSGDCGTGFEQLQFGGKNRILGPGVMRVEEGRGLIFVFRYWVGSSAI